MIVGEAAAADRTGRLRALRRPRQRVVPARVQYITSRDDAPVVETSRDQQVVPSPFRNARRPRALERLETSVSDRMTLLQIVQQDIQAVAHHNAVVSPIAK